MKIFYFSINHVEDFILEQTNMPDELVEEVSAKKVFEQTSPQVSNRMIFFGLFLFIKNSLCPIHPSVWKRALYINFHVHIFSDALIFYIKFKLGLLQTFFMDN